MVCTTNHGLDFHYIPQDMRTFMLRVIHFVRWLFCIKSKYFITAAVPHSTRSRGFGPKPVENNSNATASSHLPVQGTSKNDQEILNDLLGFLEKGMQDDTLNLSRHESIQLARDFVREHGYPVEDYCIYA